MDFKKTIFPELTVINGIPFIDGRGAFARIYCKDEFLDHGIKEEFVQTNLSINTTKGTIRGMHAQNKPCSEAKLVRCVSGRVLDVVVDLRYSSPTFLKYFSIELSANEYNAIYIPKGFVHGFQVLENNSILVYHVSANYNSKHEFGIRYDDPIVNIQWPLKPKNLSAKDLSHPLLNQQFKGLDI